MQRLANGQMARNVIDGVGHRAPQMHIQRVAMRPPPVGRPDVNVGIIHVGVAANAPPTVYIHLAAHLTF